MTDVHVHLVGLPDGKNGCVVADEMLHSVVFRFEAWRMGLPIHNAQQTNVQYIARLVKLLQGSQYVKQAVLLGMDGVYGENGELDRDRTEIMIPNDYIFEVVNRYPNLFKGGVSINPQRKDAIQELERCVQKGAALVKVIPNTQQFNPAISAYIPFYQAMVRLRIPLLCHVGYEFTLRGKDQSMGDPRHLELPLDQGVTVIAAHGMSYGLFFREKYWDTFQYFVKTYPDFYWDASALSLPNRVGMLLRIRRHPELHKRMIFGTDYPLPSFAYPALLAGQWKGYGELRKIPNPFDRHVRLLEILGLPSPANVLSLG